MLNPAQWESATIGVIALTVPALFVTVGRPWRRSGAPGARGAWIGLGVAISLLGGIYAVIGILGMQEAERRTNRVLRAGDILINLAFDIADAWGPNAWVVPLLLTVSAWAATIAAAVVVRSLAQLPDAPDVAELRALARTRDLGMLRRRYVASGIVDEEPFELATALASADRRAAGLAREVDLEYRARRKNRFLTVPPTAEYGVVLESADTLVRAVRESATVSEAERNVEALRALVLDLVSGRERDLVQRLRADVVRARSRAPDNP